MQKNNLIVATTRGLKRFERREDFWEEQSYALTGLPLSALAMQGELGLAGTKEGVFLTRDGGINWVRADAGIDTPHVRWLAIHPRNPHYFYAGTEPANIYTRQADQPGWSRALEVARLREENDWYMPYSPNPGCVRGFAFYGHRVYASVEVGGLLASSDFGASWQLVPGSTGKPHQDPAEGQIHPDVHSVATHPADPDLVYAPTGGGFYRSRDSGGRWELLYDCYCRAVWLDPEDDRHLIMGPADGVDRGGRIEESTDGGESWSLAMGNLDAKWQETMVDRFVAAGDELYAVLSDGRLLVAPVDSFSWQHLLPGIDNAVMLGLF
jgi:hypothetical protein